MTRDQRLEYLEMYVESLIQLRDAVEYPDVLPGISRLNEKIRSEIGAEALDSIKESAWTRFFKRIGMKYRRQSDRRGAYQLQKTKRIYMRWFRVDVRRSGTGELILARGLQAVNGHLAIRKVAALLAEQKVEGLFAYFCDDLKESK